MIKSILLLIIGTSSLYASSLGGTGSSTPACIGGLPNLCARADVGVQSISPFGITYGATGNIGQAVAEPDFPGTQAFRVTDANTESLGFGCCIARNSGELQAFSTVEPSGQFGSNGGYNIFVSDNAANLIFGFDQKTFAVCQYKQGAGGCATSSGLGNPNGVTNASNRVTLWTPWSFSQVQPTVVYGTSGTAANLIKYDVYQDKFYNSSNVAQNSPTPAFVDFTACPNIPTILPVGSYTGASYASRRDRYFSAVLGGTGQQYYLAVWEDTVSGNCYWQDTIHGLYGGTGITSTPTTVGMLPTPLQPALSNQGTTGTVNVCAVVTAKSTIVSPTGDSSTGETVASPEITTTAGAGATMKLTFGTPYSNPYFLGVTGCTNSFVDTSPCKPYEVYMSSNASGSCSGTEVLQNGGTAVSGPSFTIAVASIATGTATPPVATSAGFNIHQGNPNQSGSIMILANADNNSQLFLTPPNSGVPCQGGSAIVANSSCAGHAIPGIFKWINNIGYIGGASNSYAFSIRSLASPTSPTSLFPCTSDPSNCGASPSIDMHESWNVSNDLLPVEVTNFFANASISGNGSTNQNSNPCWNNQGQGWIGEVLLIATNLSGKVYRIGHVRNSACYTPWTNAADVFIGGNTPVGQISQDGKFILNHSQIGGTLGTNAVLCQNGNLYPSTGWASSHSYSVGQCIWDGAHYEVVSSISGGATCFVSNAGAAPTWPITSGLTVTDGGAVNCNGFTTPTGTWTENTDCTDQNSWIAGTGGEGCRSDVFVFKIK